jgi:plastocyanin
MARGVSLILGLLLLATPKAPAANVDGTIIVQRKLTKRKVTLQAENYQRGAAVNLADDSAPDVLAYEKAHVAIYIEGLPGSDSAGNPAPVPILSVEQKNRVFSPDFLVVPVGSVVSFPNLDPIFHNVFSLSKPKSFDLGNYPLNQTRMVTFDKPGIVMVNCHLHPNMSATIVIGPNRWATRAGETGRFSFADVPPGRYTVVAWHKTAGFFRQEVEVLEGRLAKVEFLIPLQALGVEPAHAAVQPHPADRTAAGW